MGDAQWVKVYKNEIQREIALDELVGGDPVVPDDPGRVESEWKLLADATRRSAAEMGPARRL